MEKKRSMGKIKCPSICSSRTETSRGHIWGPLTCLVIVMNCWRLIVGLAESEKFLGDPKHNRYPILNPSTFLIISLQEPYQLLTVWIRGRFPSGPWQAVSESTHYRTSPGHSPKQKPTLQRKIFIEDSTKTFSHMEEGNSTPFQYSLSNCNAERKKE